MPLVRLDGELDLLGVPEVEEALDLAGADGTAVVLDLRGLAFIDSSGLRCILLADRARRARGESLVCLASREGPVGRLVDLLDLSGEIDVREDLEEGGPPTA
ncbi:MAG TPA: STAS domain-containing protein [Miltoncostaeaceae bacterium]|nr:STAS domain-containing protein [Miltoncostaeaceae bacterium]